MVLEGNYRKIDNYRVGLKASGMSDHPLNDSHLIMMWMENILLPKGVKTVLYIKFDKLRNTA